MSRGRDSFLSFRIPGATDSSSLLVWNNAAFDDGDGDGGGDSLPEDPHHSTSTSSTWWTNCVDSYSSKENLNPVRENSSLASKKGEGNEGDDEEEKRIDREIDEIEREIARLSSRLNALKLEKAESKLKKMAERREKTITANRRGLSLGPAEILSASKARFLNKPENGILTPESASSKMSRRVSCFWRLQEIDELKVIKERGKSSSLSPKSRKPWPKAEPLQKQAATAVNLTKPGKTADLIQPRMLFREGDKPPYSVKKVRQARVVPSRYYGMGELRKRSLPDDSKEEVTKRRVSRGCGDASESLRVKKKWDVAKPVDGSSTPAVDLLPKIRTSRCANETPRDSGAAKRVAELVGRKTFFNSDNNAEVIVNINEDGDVGGNGVCQLLRFEGDD